MSETAETAAKGTTLLMVQSAFSGMFRILNIMVLTRLLLFEEMGQIAILGIIYGFVQFIGALGLNHASPLVIPEQESIGKSGSLRDYLKRGSYLIVISSSGLMTLLWILSPAIAATQVLSNQALLLITVVAPFSSLEVFLDSFLLARYKTKSLALGRIIFDVARMLGSISFVLLGYGVEGVALAWLVSEVIAVIILGRFAVSGLPVKSESIQMTAVLSFALPSLAFQLVDVTIQNTDRIILMQLTDLASLGVYDVILGMLFIMSFVSLAISTSLYPILTKVRIEGEMNQEMTIRVSSATSRMLRYIIVLLFPLAIIGALNSFAVLRDVFGPQYATFSYAPEALSMLIIAYAFWGVIYGLQTVLRSLGEKSFFLISGIIIIVFEILSCFYLTNMLGFLGSAIARVLYILMLFGATTLKLYRKQIRFEKSLAISASRILVASVIAAFTVWFIQPSGIFELVVSSALALIIYILLLFVFKEVTEFDFVLARSILPQRTHGVIIAIEALYLRKENSQLASENE